VQRFEPFASPSPHPYDQGCFGEARNVPQHHWHAHWLAEYGKGSSWACIFFCSEPPTGSHLLALPHHARPAALFWPLRVQIDPDMSSPLRKMQAVEPWASSGVAGATDAASVPHLLARWASVDGEETLLEMSHDCALERGMAE